MIITLCGSARFEPWFHAWNEALSLSGHVVFSLAAYPSQYEGVKEWYTKEEKAVLDAVHKGKIDVSHAILVLNVFAYIGESTLSEIEHARRGERWRDASDRALPLKTTYFLESWGEGNGIGGNHFEHIQKAAFEKFGVPRNFGSPIRTATSNTCPDPWGLLPDAGARRSAIVNMLHRRLDVVANGWGA